MNKLLSDKFAVGFIAGAGAALAIVAAGLTTVKLAIIDPLERREAFIEDNKKKANRKAIGR